MLKRLMFQVSGNEQTSAFNLCGFDSVGNCHRKWIIDRINLRVIVHRLPYWLSTFQDLMICVFEGQFLSVSSSYIVCPRPGKKLGVVARNSCADKSGRISAPRERRRGRGRRRSRQTEDTPGTKDRKRTRQLSDPNSTNTCLSNAPQ